MAGFAKLAALTTDTGAPPPPKPGGTRFLHSPAKPAVKIAWISGWDKGRLNACTSSTMPFRVRG